MTSVKRKQRSISYNTGETKYDLLLYGPLKKMLDWELGRVARAEFERFIVNGIGITWAAFKMRLNVPFNGKPSFTRQEEAELAFYLGLPSPEALKSPKAVKPRKEVKDKFTPLSAPEGTPTATALAPIGKF